MKTYLAIDIGGTYLKFALIDAFGKMQDVQREKTPQTLFGLKRLLVSIIAAQGGDIAGVGICCPGKIDHTQGIIFNGGALPFLHEFAICDFIETTFNLPCSVCNDGKAAALAELWLGNLKGKKNAAAIVLGTGVGGGIILDGAILQGEHFQAGELSFLPRTPESGETKNLMGVTTSAVQFIQRAAKELGLLDLDDGKAVFEALEMGDSRIKELFKNYCREVVHIILTLQAVLDIEKVVIGGGISQQPQLIREIKVLYQNVKKQSSLVEETITSVVIEKCKFGNEANLLGALYLLQLKINEKQKDVFNND